MTVEVLEGLLRAAVADRQALRDRGDEFFVAFQRPQDGVAAAVSAQHALHGEEWPPEARVRVRMGLHMGEPVLSREHDYLGLDVHRAARICSAGHGGQILLSETVR